MGKLSGKPVTPLYLKSSMLKTIDPMAYIAIPTFVKI